MEQKQKEWKFSRLIFRPINNEGFPAKYRVIFCKNLLNDELSLIRIRLYCLIPLSKIHQYYKDGFTPMKGFKDKMLVKTELNIKNLSFLQIFKIGVETKHFNYVTIEETTEIKENGKQV